MIGIATYLLGSILCGTLICFWGKRLYFPFLAGAVFLVVAAVGVSKAETGIKSLVIALIAGVLAAILAKFIYRFGVFLIGAVGGAALGLMVSFMIPEAAEERWILVSVLAIAASFCALRWCDGFIMLSTAYSGAGLIAAPVCFLALKWHSLQTFVYADGAISTMQHLRRYLTTGFANRNLWLLAATLLLTVLGFRYQRERNA